MSRLFIRQFTELGSEHMDLHWLAGLMRNETGAWFIRAVLRGMSSKQFCVRPLPIGMLPWLTLGKVFADGKLLSLSARGIIATVTVLDLSQYEEITSSGIPLDLYSFEGNKCGVQHLFRYSTDQGEILIPTVELIRFLFLHNRTLANALMRPGALNLLFHPLLPGYYPSLELQFTSEMPKNCLSNQFAQEFAWLAIEPDARRAWDSVSLESQGKQYVTFTPPPLRNSEWTFRGIRHGNCWLVLELLHLTGKCHPCDKLYYGHPLLKRAVQVSNGDKYPNDVDDDDGGGTHAPKEHITYDYRLDDGQAGSKSDNSQKMIDMSFKQSEFDRNISITKRLIDLKRSAESSHKVSASTISSVEKKQTIIVSAGEQSCSADLPPLDFRILTPVPWDSLGDLEALTDTIHQIASRLPEARFAMSLCQLKSGRAFSMVNRMPRVALVVTITVPHMPPIVLLDVERTGEIALSLMALRFHTYLKFEKMESNVKFMLDGLVDSGGHWNHEIEKKVADSCYCERLPKILTPRENAGLQRQTLIWAMKLITKLGLDHTVADPIGAGTPSA